MRVLVTGSRDLTEFEVVSRALDDVFFSGHRPEDFEIPMTVVHGGAQGADTLAAEWCQMQRELGYTRLVIEECHPADWGTYGKNAGKIRNQKMVSLGADLVLAFPRGASRGTCDCIMRAENAMIPVRLG